MNRLDELNRRLVEKWKREHKGLLWFERILFLLGVIACIGAWLLDHFMYIEDFPILVYGIVTGLILLCISIAMTLVLNAR